MSKARLPTPRPRRTFADFFAGGDRVLDIIAVWLNVFCGLYCYSYWRVIELSKAAPPREMTIGVVVIVLWYITGDKLLASTFLKAGAGGYEQVPDQQTTNTNTTTAENIAAPITGDNPTITQVPTDPKTE